MARFLSGARYGVLIAVAAAFVAFLSTLVWGAWRMVSVALGLLTALGGAGHDAPEPPGVSLIAGLDAFLLAIVLYIFGVGLYELFIGPVDLPAWLQIRSLDALKVKLVNVIALFMGVTFVEHLVEWRDPLGTLLFGTAVAVVLAALVLFSRRIGGD